MEIDQLHRQWLAHPATGRLRDHLRDRVRALETSVVDLGGPGKDPEERLASFGARRELIDLIEHLWGVWETSTT